MPQSAAISFQDGSQRVQPVRPQRKACLVLHRTAFDHNQFQRTAAVIADDAVFPETVRQNTHRGQPRLFFTSDHSDRQPQFFLPPAQLGTHLDA